MTTWLGLFWLSVVGCPISRPQFGVALRALHPMPSFAAAPACRLQRSDEQLKRNTFLSLDISCHPFIILPLTTSVATGKCCIVHGLSSSAPPLYAVRLFGGIAEAFWLQRLLDHTTSHFCYRLLHNLKSALDLSHPRDVAGCAAI